MTDIHARYGEVVARHLLATFEQKGGVDLVADDLIDQPERTLSMIARAAIDALLPALGEWQDISTAPDLERVMVCGWQKPHGGTRGYWWWREGICDNGREILEDGEPGGATHWCPVNLPPFPTPPETGL